MKVLLTTDAVGGVWQYSAELATALAGQGMTCIVANLGPSPDVDQRAMLAGAPITLIDTGLPLDWMCDSAAPVLAAGDAIAALAVEQGADLIHYNMPTLAARRPAIPALAVAHGCVSTWWTAAKTTPLDPAYRWHRTLTGQGLRAVDRVAAPTAAYAALVARHYSLDRVPLAVHNGRTPAVSLPDETPVDVALTVGRLWDGVKNAALLDRAAARLAIPLLAAGAVRGPHGETIRLDHLRALGHLSGDAIAAHLAQRPVFVSAASFEPFGLAVLEAAQAGCALVLADIPTFRELWDGAAHFVALDDERGWSAAIEALVGAPDDRAASGDAARVRAARYTPDATAAAMLALYRDLLAACPTPRKAAA